MKKIFTQSVSEVSVETQRQEDAVPRQKTLNFIRNFARACQGINLTESRTELSVMVLN